MKKQHLLFLLFMLGLTCLFSLTTGDFRSIVAAGNYNTAASWERYSSGGVWQASGVGENNPGQTPTSSNSVYIQTGHIISLTQNEAVLDLNISNGTAAGGTGTDGQLKLVTFTISVYGSLRCYYGAVGTVPGTGDNTVSNLIITTAGTTGLVKIVGNDRDITTNWGAGNTGATTAFAIEIAMNSGQTATMSKSIKAKDWKITTGTLKAGARVAVDNGTANAGDILVSSGAVFESSATGTGTSAVLGRTTSGNGGTFTNSGTFRLTGAAPAISMTTVTNNGAVEYTAAGNQALIVAINSGASLATHGDLLLGGSGIKTLAVNTTVNGKMKLSGTATLALSTFTLTYGGASTLEYAGSSAQNGATTEWPSSGGPYNVIINNSNGVTLLSTKTVSGLLTFTSGSVTLGNNNLTISGTISGTPNIIYSGTGSASNAGSSSVVAITTNAPGTLPSAMSSLTVNYAGTVTLPNNIAIGSLTVTSGSLNLNSKSLAFTGTPYLTFPGTGVVTGLGATETTNVLMPLRIDRQWAISGGISSTLHATFTWTATDDGSYNWTGETPAVFQGLTKLTTISSGLRTVTAAIISLSAKDAFTIGLEDGGGALPVELSSFTAVSSTSQLLVTLQWTTESETNNLGFNIHRSTNANVANAIQLNADIITGTNTSTQHMYNFADDTVEAPNTYYYWLEDIDFGGVTRFNGPVMVSVLEQGDPETPPVMPVEVTKLNRAYPNPFNPQTIISYDLKTDSDVTIQIFDVRGQFISTLVDRHQTANHYTVPWNGTDQNGKTVASGVYFYRMVAGKYISTQKVVLMK